MITANGSIQGVKWPVHVRPNLNLDVDARTGVSAPAVRNGSRVASVNVKKRILFRRLRARFDAFDAAHTSEIYIF